MSFLIMDDFYRNRSARLSDEIKRVVNETRVSWLLFEFFRSHLGVSLISRVQLFQQQTWVYIVSLENVAICWILLKRLKFFDNASKTIYKFYFQEYPDLSLSLIFQTRKALSKYKFVWSVSCTLNFRLFLTDWLISILKSSVQNFNLII